MMSNVDWGGLGTGLGILFVAFMQVYMAWQARRMAVKQDAKLEVVHTLVNSGMGEQLRIGMVSARTLANLQPSSENNEMAAQAEKKYLVHEASQAKADAL